MATINIFIQWITWLLACDRGHSKWWIHLNLQFISALPRVSASFISMFCPQLLFWFSLVSKWNFITGFASKDLNLIPFPHKSIWAHKYVKKLTLNHGPRAHFQLSDNDLSYVWRRSENSWSSRVLSISYHPTLSVTFKAANPSIPAPSVAKPMPNQVVLIIQLSTACVSISIPQ